MCCLSPRPSPFLFLQMSATSLAPAAGPVPLFLLPRFIRRYVLLGASDEFLLSLVGCVPGDRVVLLRAHIHVIVEWGYREQGLTAPAPSARVPAGSSVTFEEYAVPSAQCDAVEALTEGFVARSAVESKLTTLKKALDMC